MVLPAPPTPQHLAELVRDAMLAGDQASKMLGMQVLEVGPGRAVISMVVRPDMLNGHAICHGGLITTLADSANRSGDAWPACARHRRSQARALRHSKRHCCRPGGN